MSDLIKKRFLDEEGLALYDELIKEYIKSASDNNSEAVESEKERAEAAEQAIIDSVVELNQKIGEVPENETVISYIDKAVEGLVDGAPEALDTLKEIANWISDDESGSTALINRVKDNEEALKALESADLELKDYIDNGDLDVYNAIQRVDDLAIAALFPVKQSAEESAVEAIAALEEGKALELVPDQMINEDVVITKSCFINANGATFEGTVTVPAGVDVVIENATFAKPVVVA